MRTANVAGIVLGRLIEVGMQNAIEIVIGINALIRRFSGRGRCKARARQPNSKMQHPEFSTSRKGLEGPEGQNDGTRGRLVRHSNLARETVVAVRGAWWGGVVAVWHGVGSQKMVFEKAPPPSPIASQS